MMDCQHISDIPWHIPTEENILQTFNLSKVTISQTKWSIMVSFWGNSPDILPLSIWLMTMVKHFVAHKKLGTEGQFKAGLQCNVAQRSNFPPPAAVSVSVCSAPCDRTPVPGPRLSLTLPSLTLHSPSTIIAKVTLLFQYVIYAIYILYRIICRKEQGRTLVGSLREDWRYDEVGGQDCVSSADLSSARTIHLKFDTGTRF